MRRELDTPIEKVLAEACPDCGESGVLSLRDTQVLCHLCRSDRCEYQNCYRCGQQTVHSRRHVGVDMQGVDMVWGVCEKCSDEAAYEGGDEYISHLIDLRRGK